MMFQRDIYFKSRNLFHVISVGFMCMGEIALLFIHMENSSLIYIYIFTKCANPTKLQQDKNGDLS